MVHINSRENMKIVIPLAKVDVHGRHPRYVDVEDAAGRPAAREHLREQSCFWKTKGEGIRRICQCLVLFYQIICQRLPKLVDSI